MQIFVKTRTGKTLPISIELTDTAERIKELIQEIEGIPPDQIELLVRKDFIQPMEDDKAAQDYDIKEGSTLTMVLKLRGD